VLRAGRCDSGDSLQTDRPRGERLRHLPADLAVADLLDSLAFVAASTEHLLLGTAMILRPHHQPIVLAKRLATIDVLSKGRMSLFTIGVGSPPGEAVAAGMDFTTRGRRTDEAIHVLRLLWSGDAGRITYRGEFHTLHHIRWGTIDMDVDDVDALAPRASLGSWSAPGNRPGRDATRAARAGPPHAARLISATAITSRCPDACRPRSAGHRPGQRGGVVRRRSAGAGQRPSRRCSTSGRSSKPALASVVSSVRPVARADAAMIRSWAPRGRPVRRV